MTTTYIRYSQVRVGDRVKLARGFVWRNRRTAEQYDAPFLTVAEIVDHTGYGSGSVELVAEDGQVFSKPKTSKALLECPYCAPDEHCAAHQ